MHETAISSLAAALLCYFVSLGKLSPKASSFWGEDSESPPALWLLAALHPGDVKCLFNPLQLLVEDGEGPQPVFSVGLPLCRWDLGSDEDLFPHGDEHVCRCSAKLTGSFSRAHRCQQHKKPGFSVCSPVFGASFNEMLSAVTMVLPFSSGDAGPAGKQANFPNCPPTVSGAERKQPSSPASSFLWV